MKTDAKDAERLKVEKETKTAAEEEEKAAVEEAKRLKVVE